MVPYFHLGLLYGRLTFIFKCQLSFPPILTALGHSCASLALLTSSLSAWEFCVERTFQILVLHRNYIRHPRCINVSQDESLFFLVHFVLSFWCLPILCHRYIYICHALKWLETFPQHFPILWYTGICDIFYVWYPILHGRTDIHRPPAYIFGWRWRNYSVSNHLKFPHGFTDGKKSHIRNTCYHISKKHV